MAGVSVEAQRSAQDPLCAWRDYGGGYLWPYCEACENWMSAGHATCRRHVNKLYSYGHHALAAAAGAGYTAAQAAGAECPAHGPAAQAAGAGYPAAQAAGAGDLETLRPKLLVLVAKLVELALLRPTALLQTTRGLTAALAVSLS